MRDRVRFVRYVPKCNALESRLPMKSADKIGWVSEGVDAVVGLAAILGGAL